METSGISRNARDYGLKPKDIVGIPWRVAFALQADGWYLRSDIIWSKPNPMPESVTDRPTKAHEYIFLISKSERYFYDNEAIREDAAKGAAGSTFNSGKTAVHQLGRSSDMDREETGKRNRRTVWEIATKPFPEAHFAVYPPTLIEPCILAGTSEEGCCAACGAPWGRIIELGEIESTGGSKNNKRNGHTDFGGSDMNCGTFTKRRHITKGWQATCECNAEPTPCTVLDPFGGAGTTALVALAKGRNAILCELNPEYAEMARKRIENDAPMFNRVRIAA